MGNKQGGSRDRGRKGGGRRPHKRKNLTVVAWGDWGTCVGKSSIGLRCSQNIFLEDEDVGTKAAIGGTLSQGKIFRLQDGREVEIIFWDGSGNEKYRAIEGSAWRFPIVLICYDVTNRESFDHMDEWMTTCNRWARGHGARIMCGLKIDNESERQVSRSEGESKAHQHGADHFCELSSKSNVGIEEMLHEAARIALDLQATK